MIEVRNLTKKYGDNLAVDNLSFTVKPGMIYGFLGPNGAGKSTTMNIITGCLAASSGTVLIDGHDIFEEPLEAKKLIGYLPEQPPLYFDMTPYEYLNFVADAKRVKPSEKLAKIEDVMARTGISDVANRLIKNLSKGYRQRVGIAQAMLGDPEIIILDEPTVGLDPRQIIEIRELVASLAQEHTVILSSHILSEVQTVCDYAIIISHGRVVASDTVENLEKGNAQYRTLKLVIKATPEQSAQIIDSIEEISHYAILEAEDGTSAELTVPSEYDVRELLFNRFSEAGLPILEMEVVRPSLEQVYLRLTDVDLSSVKNEEAADDDTSENDGSEDEDGGAESADGGENGAPEKPTCNDGGDSYVSPFAPGEEDDK